MRSRSAAGFVRALAIGLGSTLRRDDGVGARAAEMLEAAGLPARALLQPLPELALELAGLDRVVFLDADRNAAPGEVRLREISEGAEADLGHGFDVPAVLGLCRALVGRAPEAWLLSVGVADLGLGETLSQAVEAAMPGLVARARALLAA